MGDQVSKKHQSVSQGAVPYQPVMTIQIGIPVTSASGFGLDVCMVEGRGLVERIDPLGAVAQWNTMAAPETQIGLGDRIEGFKVKGQSSQKLISGKEFSHVTSSRVLLEVTKPSIYSVKAKAPFGIGMKRRANSDKTYFVVSHLNPTGSIEEWNKEFPEMPVSIGDIVREVDGVQGSAAEVQQMLANDPDKEKALLIFHFPTPQPPRSATAAPPLTRMV